MFPPPLQSAQCSSRATERRRTRPRLFQLQSAPRLTDRALRAALFAARTNSTAPARRSIAEPWRERPRFLTGGAVLAAATAEVAHATAVPVTAGADGRRTRASGALQEKLLNQELFDEFCQEFTREMNRLRMARRASLSSAKREVERISTRIKKLLNLLIDDEIAVDEGKAEIKALDARRKELQVQLESADEPPPLLHPEMAELYRQQVTTLAHSLEAVETRTEATEALRGLIDAIVMTPADGTLRIELRGNLAAMLGATVQSKRSPETGDLSLQVSMVAGGRI